MPELLYALGKELGTNTENPALMDFTLGLRKRDLKQMNEHCIYNMSRVGKCYGGK